MKKGRFFFYLAVLFLTFYSDIAYPQQQTSISITANELVKIAAENIEKSDLLKKELISFERTRTEHELDRSGNRKSVLDSITTYHGKEYSENQRTEDRVIVDFNKLLLKSYDYFFLNDANPTDKNILSRYPYECNNCYFVRFEPKRNLPNVEDVALPGAGLFDKGINETAMRMNGVIYIDKDHFFIRKHIGELDRGFNKYGVRIIKASIDLEQELRPDLNNLIVIKSVKFMYQVRTLRTLFLSYLTREHETKYSSYRLNKL